MDLYVDPGTNDLVIAGGRPVMLTTAASLKAQRIRNRLLTVRGSWFDDINYGLDFHGVVWVKSTPRPVLYAHIQNEILKAADTGDRITKFEAEFDGITRKLSVLVEVVPFGGAVGETISVSI